MELDIGAAVELGFTTSLEKNKGLFRPVEVKPVFRPVSGSNAAQGGGSGVIRIGRPPTGRIWNILSVTTLGSDDHTSVTGTVGIYTDADSANLNLASCLIPNLSIPFFQTVGRRTIWAHSTGDVCANLVGVTGTNQVIVTIGVAEFIESEITMSTTK